MNKRRVAMGVAFLAGAVFLAQACSLGEGKTPDCDPNAPLGSDAACLALHECDDGHGGIAQGNEPCCLRRASYEFARCEDVDEPDDFRPACTGVTTGCCATATNLFDVCMTQGLTTSASTTGGMGGATTAGGMGGTGGTGGVSGGSGS